MPTILAEIQGEVWIALIAAIGVAITTSVVSIMTAAFQLWMSYRASVKTEAVRIALEGTNKAAADTAKSVTESNQAHTAQLDKIEQITNHNYQKMQEESAQSRKALEAANEEIARGNKEVAEMAKSLALMVQAKSVVQHSATDQATGIPPSLQQPSSPTGPKQLDSSAGDKDSIKVAKLEVELQSKPTQASKDGVEGKEDEKEIKVEKLDLELVSKPQANPNPT